MNVGIKASNLGVIGDCGRYPMFIETRKRAIKYWLKILKNMLRNATICCTI